MANIGMLIVEFLPNNAIDKNIGMHPKKK